MGRGQPFFVRRHLRRILILEFAHSRFYCPPPPPKACLQDARAEKEYTATAFPKNIGVRYVR